MRISDTFQSAFHALNLNKMRSALTMLGIIIGVGSVVLMVSVGRSFEGYILSQVESFGGNLIEIQPAGLEKFGRNLDVFNYGDYEAVAKLSTVENVSPVIFVSETVHYGTEEIAPFILGGFKEVFNNFSVTLDEGRLLDDRDEGGARNVVVLSSKAVTDLFGSKNPIGKKVTIGGRALTVVGTLESYGSAMLEQLDTMIYMPFSTARSLTGKKYIDYISAQAVGDEEIAVMDITTLLRKRHGIRNPEGDPDKDDFTARSGAQAAEVIGQVTLGLTVFLGLIAAVSLLVGGIGIMNIMLVSVTERTREIGLRKALGARRRDVLFQFLIEAVVLTLLGGIIGLLGGISIGLLLAAVADKLLGGFELYVSVTSITAAVSMALLIGLVFGIYPAKKAASLSPIEAMRW